MMTQLLPATLQLTVHILILCESVVRVTAEDSTGDISLVSCVRTHRSWIEPDRITITWQWAHTPNTTDTSVVWKSDFNTGQCSQATSTSCMCLYGDGNCMDFQGRFDISVTADGRTHTLSIDPDACRKPPEIDSLTVLPVNSTCLGITWFYNRSEPMFCSDNDARVYQIAYRAKPDNNTKCVLLESIQSCNSSYSLCGLAPYTQYEVEVRCRFTDHRDRATGRWSEPAENTSMTLQSVPDGAPGVIAGGFSHIYEDCVKDRRKVRVYWQPVDPVKRNGIINWYYMTVFSYHDITKVFQWEFRRPGETIHVDLNLTCTLKYALRLAAATVIGVSSVVAEMDIPERHPNDVPEVLEVIPIVTRNGTMTVTWKLHDSAIEKISNITVFWCSKTLSRECRESPGWSVVPSNSTSLTVSPSSGQPLHHYMVGASAGSHGITWTTCQFSAEKVPFRPTEVTVVSVALALSVSWENSPCESRPFGPYIDHFAISVCPVLNEKNRNCSGDVTTVEVDHDSSSHLLSDLDPDTVYKVNIVAFGTDNEASPPSHDVFGTVTEGDVNKAPLLIAVFVPLSVVVVVGASVVLFLGYRRLRQRLETQTHILLPPIPEPVTGEGARLNGHQVSVV